MNTNFNRSVYINCPYDEKYLSMFRVMIFTIHACGFEARFAFQKSSSTEDRVGRIAGILKECRLSVHDVSYAKNIDGERVRLNMSFECGMAFGMQNYDESINGSREILILGFNDIETASFLSNVRGRDPAYHEGKPINLVREVRRFLCDCTDSEAESTPKRVVPGHTHIFKKYKEFVCHAREKFSKPNAEFTIQELLSIQYLQVWQRLASTWLGTQ